VKNEKKAAYVKREKILELLSDEEVARVSDAETAVRLSEGDEYLDLERLERGIQQAGGLVPAMGRVLLRKSILDTTWGKIARLIEGGVGHVGPSRDPHPS
jgi:hypothetical protein